MEAQIHEPAIPRIRSLEAKWPSGQIVGDLGFHTQDDLSIWDFGFGGWGRIGRSFALEGAVGFVSVGNGDSETGVTNPWIAGYFVHESHRVLIRAGLGLAPPVIDDEFGFLTLALWFARGLRDIWLFTPNHLGFVPTFRLDATSGDILLLGLDAQLGMLFPTEDGVDTEVVTQSGADAALRIHPNVHLGARIQFGWFLSEDDDDVDLFQLSAIPFLRVLFGSGFAEARLLINLDEPAGFAFDDGKVWMLHLRGGAVF